MEERRTMEPDALELAFRLCPSQKWDPGTFFILPGAQGFLGRLCGEDREPAAPTPGRACH